MHPIVSEKRKVICFQENEKKQIIVTDHFRENQKYYPPDFQHLII